MDFSYPEEHTEIRTLASQILLDMTAPDRMKALEKQGAYLDRELSYRFVNQAFATLARLPQEQIYGRTPEAVLAKSVANFLRPILKRAQAGERVEYERVGLTTEGSQRWMHGRIVPDLDAAGQVRGLYCTEYDIHELKTTEQALAAREEQLRLFTDNIPEPVVYLDGERRLAFVNEAFLDLTGLERERVVGREPAEVMSDEQRIMQDEYVARAPLPHEFQRSGTYSVEVSRDGGATWVAAPSTLEVRESPRDGPRIFDVSDQIFGGCRPDDSLDDALCVAKAIQAATAFVNADPRNLATVYFPPGSGAGNVTIRIR